MIGNYFWGGAAAPYEIEQSLRFNPGDSTYLNWTPGSAGDRTEWTWSAWVKRSAIGSTMGLFGSYTASNNNDYLELLFASGNTFLVQGNSVAFLNTSQVFRDTSAWYHIVVAVDTSNATADDRIKVYVNGDQVTAFATRNNPGSGVNLGINQAGLHRLGRRPSSNNYFNGYMAEVNFIDGTALDHTSFGEEDENGVWRPIKYAGSYTGNSFYLKFASGDGTDSSGLSNTWTANNFTTSGTGTDVMSDTPTTNWATLNPLWNPIQATYAEGNLKFTGGSEHSPSASSISASSGKYYFEAKALSGSAAKWSLGIIDTAIGYRKSSGNNYIPGYNPNNVYSEGDAISLYDNNIYKNGSIVVSSPFSGGAIAAGDVVQMAVDIDAGKIWFGIDGTWNNGGGTEGAFDPSGHDATFAANEDYIFHFTAESCGWTVNFGQRDFEQTVPTGFNALNTANLPAPDIADGSQYFTTLAYSGTSTTDSKVIEDSQGNDWAPDFVWLKKRNSGANHMLYDRVRGASKSLRTNTTGAEVTGATNGDLTAFTSTGFTLNSGNDVNASGNTYVAWNWLAANGTSTPSGGSIASTVSANPSAGFSIVSYTGTGANATVAHGLGVAPTMFITKSRDGGSWGVYHASVGANYILYLDLTDAAFSNVYAWNNTAPTSTVFTVSQSDACNTLNEDYIAYCFAEVEGYSKFGSYLANNSADGPFVYLGFTPKFLIIKSTTARSWLMMDTERSPYNSADLGIRAEESDAEETNNWYIDFLSNGFKIRGVNANTNTDASGVYTYAAFAENPFGGSGVSPATAR